jgi:hypothetical protein
MGKADAGWDATGMARIEFRHRFIGQQSPTIN